MSFHCKACGRQRAESPADVEGVCDECRPMQAGRACLLIAHFENHRLDADQILALDNVLDDASNGPPDGAGDGSLAERRWVALRILVDAARAYNRALNGVQQAVSERREERQ